MTANARTRPTLGYPCVIAAAVLWALCGVAGKLLFADGITPLQLVQVRVTLSATLLGPTLAVWDRSLLRARPRELLRLGALGVIGALVQVLYYTAIARIQVAAAILLQYMSPVLIAVFAMAFWKERLTAAKASALALAVAGCYLVTGAYDLALLSLNRWGILAGLGSATAFAAYSLLAERAMHDLRPFTVLLYSLVFSTLAMHVAHPPLSSLGAGYTARQWAWIGYTVVGGTILPFGLYFIGINHLRATRANITATLEPIAAGFLALGLLDETMALLQVLGGAAVIAAIALLQLQREADPRTPAALRRPEEPRTG